MFACIFTSPLKSEKSSPAVDRFCFSCSSGPKVVNGRTALTTNCGFCSFANFHIAFSASTLLAAYVTIPLEGSYGGGAHASGTTASFQESSSTWKGVLGIGIAAATTVEVYTNRLTVGSFAAAFNAFTTPAIV